MGTIGAILNVCIFLHSRIKIIKCNKSFISFDLIQYFLKIVIGNIFTSSELSKVGVYAQITANVGFLDI